MSQVRTRTWRRLVIVVFAFIFVAIVYRWISLERLLQHASPLQVRGSPTPEPTPTRTPVITGKIETAKLFNGITVHSRVETPAGTDATTERTDPESYVLDLTLQARAPQPNKSIEELAKVNPRLPELLPGLAAMIGPDSVSPLYNEIYATKIRSLHDNLQRLDLLLSRHNFYDCQTILQFQSPQTHRRATLLQADMDVDADGSDADRMPAGPAVTTNFKPFTSYKWQKKTAAPNPYLPAMEDRLKRAEDEMNTRTTSAERKRDLRGATATMREEIATLKKFSFLIGAADPYIVVPGAFARTHDAARVGDYAVVIYGDGIYPALVGDVGPNDKVGEASLRIAKEVNPQSTAYNRPVSELKVSYLIFPNTADTPFGPPDYDKIQARCQQLINEIGGATVALHHWENIIPPPPTPTPSPAPAPSVSPSLSASPSNSPLAPSASPAPTFAFPLNTPSG